MILIRFYYSNFWYTRGGFELSSAIPLGLQITQLTKYKLTDWGEGALRLSCCNCIWRILVENPPDTWSISGTQLCNKAPGDHQLKTKIRNTVINVTLVKLFPWKGPQGGHGAAKQYLKKKEINISIFSASPNK